MHRIAFALLSVLAFAAGFACTAHKPEPAPAPEAPVGATLLEGLGSYRASFSPANPAVAKWFDQGLSLAYGFNHDAAERSFLKATEQDPNCAICWWGAALVLGPHVNATMDPANNGKAWMRVQKAQSLAVSPVEKAYIKALSARYTEQPPEDRKPLDEAYAEAMERLVQQFPDDMDGVTLYAESLMNLQPWDYYDAQQQIKGNTGEFVKALEHVIKRMPDHPGALHLYIHAVEASSTPGRGVAAADRLRELLPGSGHLVHMPAHIYTRVGRYHDAVIANQKAIAADNTYLAACTPAPGVYPLGYVPHNHHFLWWASSMEGASGQALAAAEETAKRAWIPDLIKTPGFEFLQDFWVTPIKAKVRFARWRDIANTPKPPDDLPYPQAIWHFGQGMAAAAQGRPDEAQKHWSELARAAADPMFEKFMVGPQHALSRTLKVAERVLAGEVAAGRKDYKAAIAALEQAVKEEDANAYFEPPLWHHPTRHTLGTLLLRAGKPGQAEKIFREDLKRNHNNGWSLDGLARSLKAQGKKKESAKVESRLRIAWRHADATFVAGTP